jgi:predicted GIY-YIG superfamily endonuclease
MQAEISPTMYIFASKRNAVIYMGVASVLRTRVALHREEIILGSPKNMA